MKESAPLPLLPPSEIQWPTGIEPDVLEKIRDSATIALGVSSAITTEADQIMQLFPPQRNFEEARLRRILDIWTVAVYQQPAYLLMCAEGSKIGRSYPSFSPIMIGIGSALEGAPVSFEALWRTIPRVDPKTVLRKYERTTPLRYLDEFVKSELERYGDRPEYVGQASKDALTRSKDRIHEYYEAALN